MEPLTEADGEFKDTLICRENEDIARGVQDGRADFAVLQMFLHLFAYLRIERIL
jgi:hypothetical protein